MPKSQWDTTRNTQVNTASRTTLIVTNEGDFSRSLAQGYQANGYNAVLGLDNFWIHTASFDVVHVQWPEELCGWRPRSEHDVEKVAEHLMRWKQRSKIVFSVNNLYPHNQKENPFARRLYELFLQTSDVVMHYSQASKDMVADFYSDTPINVQVVTCPPNWHATLQRQMQRGGCRQEFGFSDDDFVVLLIGRIRSKEEFLLLRRGLRRISGRRGARLLVAAKYQPSGSAFVRYVERIRWNSWLQRKHAVVVRERVPEEKLSILLDTSDLVVVPRLEGISSGIALLAMTFGVAIVAPQFAAYPEYLKGTRNRMFDPGSADSLDKCITEIANSDYKSIGEENARIAASWEWKEIVGTCLSALPK